jgi:hypothetical protein
MEQFLVMKESFEAKLARVAGTIRYVTMDDPHLRREEGLLHYLNKADGLHASALALASDRSRDHLEAFALLAGFSIEVLLKGTLVGLRQKFSFTHNLVKLSEDAGISISQHDRAVLESLTVYTTWKSRYPAAKEARETKTGLEKLEVLGPTSGTLLEIFEALDASQMAVNAVNYNRVYEFFLQRFFEVHSSVHESATFS